MKLQLIACGLLAVGIHRAAAEVKTIQRAEAAAYQESLTRTETVAFLKGGSTGMTPVQWIPERTNIKPLALDGNWQVTRWPFPTSEKALAGSTTPMAHWQAVVQPGSVFYFDPNQSPHTISNWNRVTLAHLHPEDGAIFRRTVRVPREWKGKRILLRFEGIYPAGRIYWDGKIVGEQWSGLTRTEFDVTDCARPGREHILAVRLYRRHASVQLDMPRHALEFAGLSRTAFLHAVEPLHVADSFLQPDLAEDYRTGTLRGSVTIRNAGTQDAHARSRLRVRVEDATGRSVAPCDYCVTVLANQKQQIDLDLLVGAVKTWNAERPNRYCVHLELTGPGKETQRITRLVGFRRFELKDQRPLLNGHPVKFRGVNHLTFHPET